jgi:two-component system chemotaxis response regulator CheY
MEGEPISRSDAGGTGRAQFGEPPKDERQLRALVIDDVPAMRHFLRVALHSVRGLAVDEAKDGLEALHLWSQMRYDIILLDLNLPLLDGMKLLALIRSAERIERNVPVVVISTIADAETMERVSDLAVSHILPKPVQAFQVVDAVREALRIPEAGPVPQERRRSRRLQIPVSLTFEDGGAVETCTWDISPGGAFIMSEHPLPIDAQGRLRLHLPRGVVEVECQVMHVRPRSIGNLPAGFGARFSNVSAADAAALRDLFQSVL